jgi:CheY-like chemotaxis protein
VARASELTPDVVIADCSMAMDGYRVASAIKSTPGLERTAVILLASQKQPYDEAKGRAAGVDDHVVKPFDTQHVIDKVKRVMSQPRAAAPKAAAQQPAASAAAAQSRMSRPGGTIAFERAPVQQPPAQAAPPAQQARPAAGPPPSRQQAPVASPMVAAAASAGVGDMAQKLDGLGLTPEQVQGVLALSREVIEKVVWEVVPDLAETLIREEIRRLTQ